jgi:hypothetical protein
MTPKNELLFCGLGGSGEIGMNVNLYGCQGKWVMVDLGITFADPQYPGVDVIPICPSSRTGSTTCSASSSRTAMRITSARCRTSPKTSACRSTRPRSRWA